MDFLTIIILVALILSSISSYKLWKKNDSRLAMQNFFIFAVAVIILLWPYFSKNILHLDGQIAIINYNILQIFRFIIVGFLTWIMIKDFVPDINKK